jgi:hypothetical protein
MLAFWHLLLRGSAKWNDQHDPFTGYDEPGSLTAGIDAAGIDAAGIDAAGIDAAGIDAAGIDAAGIDAAGIDAAESDAGPVGTASIDESGTHLPRPLMK